MTPDAERANPFEEAVSTAIDGAQSKMWTALPGEIVSFDEGRQTASVQTTIQAKVTDSSGKASLATLPLLVDCPVHFPRGGGCVLTFPVTKGDECLVVFASRCIDAWWQSGGVQPQAEVRMHDLSDGFVFVGFSSIPHVVASLSTTATQLRSLDGATSISLDPTAQSVALTAPGGIVLDGPVTSTSTIIAVGDVTGAGVSLSTHLHGGVEPGAGTTGAPIS